MAVPAQTNQSKYKSAFSNNAQIKNFVKVTPFSIVPGYTPEQGAAIGFGKQEAYPKPTDPCNPHKK